jgi:indolepyruvate ferredoxin oxidoreductase alpha subunit
MTPACVQTCPTHVLHPIDLKDLKRKSMPEYPVPSDIAPFDITGIKRPERLSLSIRGVGGQGNLFFGHVLTQLAFLAGYDKENLIKGETRYGSNGRTVISTSPAEKHPAAVPCPNH